MNVLITGGAGFIGHYAIDLILQKTDWNIISLDRLDFSGNLNRLNEIVDNDKKRSRVKILYHDLKAAFNSQLVGMLGDINIILHFAAGSHVDRSIEYPIDFAQDNVIGTLNLLEYAKSLKNLHKLVYFSTDEVFGPAPKDVKFKEYDRYNSTNPYSASKASAEEFCVAYHNTYSMPIYITHTMNVFGKRQHPEKYIPKCIKKLLNGEVISIHSDPSCSIPGSRMYIHAEDVILGILYILNLDYQTIDNGLNLCPKFNLAGLKEIDNLTVAKKIAEVMNVNLKYELKDFHSSRPGHDLRYALDGTLLENLGWKPKLDFETSIEEIITWTLNNPQWLINEI